MEEPEDELQVGERALRQDEPDVEAEPKKAAGEIAANNERNQPRNEGYQLRDKRMLRLPERYRDFIDNLFLAESQEPLSYREAMQSEEAEKWKRAMDEEFESLMKNQAWELVKIPTNVTTIDCKWTYKLKRDADGNIKRHKARLVARGFRQREGIDYQETHSPVIRFYSIRAILAVASCERMHIKQFDVKTTFLYGDIEETIHMQEPEGYDDGSGKVCRLKRSLYGLKQASRCWNRKFTNFLRRFKLKATTADSCVFTGPDRDHNLILAIYIDDGLVAARDPSLIDKLLEELKNEFEITHNEANLFLGLHIEREADGSIFLHQEAYAKRIIERFRLEEANPVAIPADLNQ